MEFGDEIGPVIRRATYEQVYGFLSLNQRRIPLEDSYDLNDEVAKARGLRSPTVPATLLQAFAIQLLTDWHGPLGWIRSLNINFRRTAHHNEDLRFFALVTDTRGEDDQTIVKLDLFLEDIRGDRAVQGVAEIALPTSPNGATGAPSSL